MKRLIILLFLCSFAQAHDKEMPFYICTAADSKYYTPLLQLIGSLQSVDFDKIGQIAVFDLGLSNAQKKHLNGIDKVQVYSVDTTNPNVLKSILTHPGKRTPGSYAWKPVVIKQALDMFPYVLYIDAGTTVLKSLENVFKHIIQNGYFIIDVGPWSIQCQCTRKVIKRFSLQSPHYAWILDEKTHAIDAGIQGVSRALYDSYIMPLYQLSVHEMDLFIDDGTALRGFGTARHDQALFSIYARMLGLEVLLHDTEGTGQMTLLKVDEKTVPIHITWNPIWVSSETTIYRSRWHLENLNYYTGFIRKKRR